MKALIYYCPYLDRGVECGRASMDGSIVCGCPPRFRRGLSQSHRRCLQRQLGLGRLRSVPLDTFA